MNKYLKKALVISSSVLMFLSVGAGINNVQARHYRYRYHRRASHNKYGYWKHYRRHGRRHSYFVRYKTGYYHNGHWVRYHGHSHFVVHFRRITPKRRYRAHRVHHYHIDVEGVDDGWTTNYHYYKSESAKIQHAIDVQTAKDEEAEGLDPNQINNTKRQHHHGHSHFHVKFRKISGPSNDDTNTDTTTDTNVDDTPLKNTKTSISKNLREFKSRTLADINQEREENGEQPYQESQALDQIANIRAQQDADNPSNPNPHMDPNTGNRYVDEDAQELGYNMDPSENADQQMIGDQETYYGAETNPRNGIDMADQANDSMMNHDSFCGNGHRNNILDPTSQYVGVGAAYNSSNNYYYLVEDFSTYVTKGDNNGSYSNPGVTEHNGSYDPYSWIYNHGNN